MSLHSLCNSLKLFVDMGVNIKVIFYRSCTDEEMQELVAACPEAFNIYPGDAVGPRMRTKWITSYGCQVALDGSSHDNPWSTGRIF